MANQSSRRDALRYGQSVLCHGEAAPVSHSASSAALLQVLLALNLCYLSSLDRDPFSCHVSSQSTTNHHQNQSDMRTEAQELSMWQGITEIAASQRIREMGSWTSVCSLLSGSGIPSSCQRTSTTSTSVRQCSFSGIFKKVSATDDGKKFSPLSTKRQYQKDWFHTSYV